MLKEFYNIDNWRKHQAEIFLKYYFSLTLINIYIYVYILVCRKYFSYSFSHICIYTYIYICIYIRYNNVYSM